MLPDDTAALRARIEALPGKILQQAQIATDKVCACMEEVIGTDIAGVRTVPPSKLADTGERSHEEDDESEDSEYDEEQMMYFDAEHDQPVRRRRRPVSLDDPDFAEKINLILNDVIVVDAETLHAGAGDPSSVASNLLNNLSHLYDYSASGESQDSMEIECHGDPINEYGNSALLYYLAFPGIFPLAKGLEKSGARENDQPGKLTGLPIALARHLLLQGSCTAAHDNRCYFLAFNQLQRHSAASITGFRLRNSSDVAARFTAIVNDPGFVQRLRKAKQDPESDDAKQLVMLISPLLASASRSIPYSPQARKSSFANFVASYYRFACNFLFVTMAFNDRYACRSFCIFGLCY